MPTANLQPVDLCEPSQSLADPLNFDGADSWMEEPLLLHLTGLVYAKMGDSCLQRLGDFRRWPDGWDNGEGRAIALPTLLNLQKFLLSGAKFPTARPPSLFLTKDGALEILCRTAAGERLQVILTPNGTEYYFEPSDEEGAVGDDDLAGLIEKFNRLMRD